MPKLAKTIKIYYNKTKRLYSLEIDGEDFPYYIDETGISVPVSSREFPTAILTILAEKVEVINDWTEDE